MSKEDDAKKISAAYRGYCDACQSGRLTDVPNFWSLPALFTVDMGEQGILSSVVTTSDEMVALYSKLFGPSTGVDETIIDTSEVLFYGDNLATIATELRHLAGGELHDKQKAVYGARKVGDNWVFISHLSVDID